MSEPYMTYALWGTGNLTPESATALLEEYIPDNVGTVYRPERVSRDEKGLRTALDWFESPDFLGDGGAVPTTDIVQSLTFDRDTQGDEVYVLALWPETPSHEDFDFIESVQASGITVYDLSRALDELDLSLYERPAPTKEEKAEARAAAKAEKGESRGRTSTRKLSDATPEEAPAQEAEVPVVHPDSVVPEDTGAHAVRVAESIVSDEFARSATADKMLAAIQEYIAEEVTRQVAAALVPDESVSEQDMERPPFEPPYIGEDTKEYFWRKSANTFRPADGKPRRGEIVINLTDEEARERGIE